jgi:hypothetical protein
MLACVATPTQYGFPKRRGRQNPPRTWSLPGVLDAARLREAPADMGRMPSGACGHAAAATGLTASGRARSCRGGRLRGSCCCCCDCAGGEPPGGSALAPLLAASALRPTAPESSSEEEEESSSPDEADASSSSLAPARPSPSVVQQQ